jgi:hypothetical protein
MAAHHFGRNDNEYTFPAIVARSRSVGRAALDSIARGGWRRGWVPSIPRRSKVGDAGTGVESEALDSEIHDAMPTSATLLLIRHAEKPVDPHEQTLSAAGQARAQAYVAYFRNLVLDSKPMPAPSFLIAAADSKNSIRSRLTLMPLAQSLGLPIDAAVADLDYPELAGRLLGDDRYDHATTLVCWHHGQILALAHALGAPESALPGAWPDDVFGWLLRLDFDAAGHLTKADVGSQRLMFGDQTK